MSLLHDGRRVTIIVVKAVEEYDPKRGPPFSCGLWILQMGGRETNAVGQGSACVGVVKNKTERNKNKEKSTGVNCLGRNESHPSERGLVKTCILSGIRFFSKTCPQQHHCSLVLCQPKFSFMAALCNLTTLQTSIWVLFWWSMVPCRLHTRKFVGLISTQLYAICRRGWCR